MPEKKEHPKEKLNLHPRNKHRERYDFRFLINTCRELSTYVKPNIYNDDSIDFFNPAAVKTLNKALLKCYYNIDNWDIPKGYLCPPIPGRADYIHSIADLLSVDGIIPIGSKVKCLDIGVGANCVYPFIGNKEYGWSFVGTDIDPLAISSANKIIESNPHLKGEIEIRLQKNLKDIFAGVVSKNERFDVTICNPPFHSSLAEAQQGTLRKLSNLKQKKIADPTLNFGGKNNELWCDGGEAKFVKNMILQSKEFSTSCLWFSSLISNSSNLKNIYNELEKINALEVKTIAMGQGNKISRIVCWTFQNEDQRRS